MVERASLENGFKHFRTPIKPYNPHVLMRQVGSLVALPASLLHPSRTLKESQMCQSRA